MYYELFEKMGLKSLWSYEGLELQAFSGTTICQWGYGKIMIYVGERKDVWSISSQFLVVHNRSEYNYGNTLRNHLGCRSLADPS